MQSLKDLAGNVQKNLGTKFWQVRNMSIISLKSIHMRHTKVTKKYSVHDPINV